MNVPYKSASPMLRRTLRTTGLAGALALCLAGCKGNNGGNQTAALPGGDPADANLAQPYTGGAAGGYTSSEASGSTRVMGQSQSATPQSTGENYETQSAAPIIRQAPQNAQSSQGAPSQYYPVPQAGPSQGANYNGDPNAQGPYPNQGSGFTDAEEAGEQALAATDQPPPPLPEYDQPPAPEDNYIWNPGYWNYASTGYYFVPGIWCAPPFYGALWTPPYWGYYNNRYLFHRGYWGPHIGYYGGINYGFGYIGTGYYGGYWRGHDFFYNRAVTNVNVVNVHNVYQRTVIYNNQTYGPRPVNRVSYNGGPGGLRVQPRPEEVAAMHEAHYAPLPAQRENRLAAASNRSQFFAANAGRPAVAFTPRPVGAVNNIPAAPREQAFNHPTSPAAQTPNGRPGEFNRPGFQGGAARINDRAGVPASSAFNNNRAGEFNRPNTSSQPAFNNARPAPTQSAAPTQPAYSRPENLNRPGAPAQPTYNRPAQPAYNHPAEPAQPAPQPRATYARPAPQTRPEPSSPPVQNQRPYQAPTQPQTRTPVEESHPAPAFTPPPRPQPQVSAPHPSAPAPAPHAESPQPHAAPAANGRPH